MRKRHCIMQAQNYKCSHIKLWIIKELSISWAFNIICILVYCGLYTMTIDIVTWRIIKKWCIWSLHLCDFLCLPIFALFLQKLCQLLRNSSNFIYIYLKWKLGTEKYNPKYGQTLEWGWSLGHLPYSPSSDWWAFLCKNMLRMYVWS